MAIIGIDLGTSNSAAAVLRGGRLVIIPSAEGISLGAKAFPSYVAITADGRTRVGEPARRQLKADLQEVGKKLYADAAAKASAVRPNVQEATGEARPSGPGPRGKVVDAEVRETKRP